MRVTNDIYMYDVVGLPTIEKKTFKKDYSLFFDIITKFGYRVFAGFFELVR